MHFERCVLMKINRSRLQFEPNHLILRKTPEKKFTCDVCGQKFKRNEHLISHREAKHEKKKAKCQRCGTDLHPNGRKRHEKKCGTMEISLHAQPQHFPINEILYLDSDPMLGAEVTISQ